MIQVIALTGPFPNTSENRIAAVTFGDVIDQFHDQNRLAHTGTAEQANLTALGVRGQQVNDLNAGHQNF